MKKLFFTLCALCLCGTMWGVGYQQTEWADTDRDAATVYTDSQTGLSFYVLDGSAVLTYAEASSSNYSSLTSLTLPETVSDGTSTYTVTKVGDYAFDHASNIKGELVVPANILTLGRSAFEGCTGITAVTIDYAETALGNSNNQNWGTPFYSCSGITTVTLNRDLTQGRGVTSGYRTELFSDLTNIETVYIGENVTEILHDLFNCNSSSSCKLATVYCYAATVPSLGSGAFDSHTGLTLHVCESLGDAYSSSDWATYFSIIENDLPDPGLEEGTYLDITTNLYFEINEDGTTASIYHDELGVYDNNNLVAHETIANAYTLPETVSADGVTYYNVTRIEESAFEGSNISGHLVIPAHITAVGEKAFMNSTQITEVTYEYSATALSDESSGNNTGTESFNGCSGVTTVNLYRNITAGHDGYLCTPFCYHASVATVNIGPRVTYIPGYMFRNTSTKPLTTINVYSVTPPGLGTAPFDNLNDNYVINVPFGAESLYTTDSYWATYATTGHIAEMSNAFAITTNEGDDYAYATFYNGASAVEFFNAEATVYAATSVEIEDGTGNVYINDLGSVVPEATAVLVETSGAQTMLAIATSEDVTAPTTNYLYGYDTATTITTPAGYVYYMLTYGADGGSLGFYWGAEDGGAFTSAAHKAYLAIPSNSNSGISIRKGNGGDDTTGISSVEASDGAKVSGIYTIQGVRVSNMSQPGLYIVDGKKVLVK